MNRVYENDKYQICSDMAALLAGCCNSANFSRYFELEFIVGRVD